MARPTSPPGSPVDASNEAEVRHPTLNARLAAYRRESARLRPAFAKVYDELIARLDVLDSGEVGPKIGEPLPDFNLPDENGSWCRWRRCCESGPAVISFNRGHWCPYCKLELRSLAAIDDRDQTTRRACRLDHAGQRAIHRRLCEAERLPFPVLSDIDLGYSLSLGLIFWVGAEIQRLYQEAGVELEKYQATRDISCRWRRSSLSGRTVGKGAAGQYRIPRAHGARGHRRRASRASRR